MRWRRIAAVGVLVLAAGGQRATAASGVVTVFAAGTLAVPFSALDPVFQRLHPGSEVRAIFGGSVKMARQITDLHRPADVLAVADYSVIPRYLFGKDHREAYARWYVGFARNAVTFMYTGKSRFAKEITTRNWYRVLARKGVEIGRSNPDTDPSGYQTLQMLALAERYYGVPDLAAGVLANAPPANMRDTETSLISALQLGQIDYLAIYRSDALQHNLRYLKLPAEIDLSDPARAAHYATAVAHTKNGDIAGKPIVYAVTIPENAPHPRRAAEFVALLLGRKGRKVMTENGFGTFTKPYAVHVDAMPAALRPLVTAWPQP